MFVREQAALTVAASRWYNTAHRKDYTTRWIIFDTTYVPPLSGGRICASDDRMWRHADIDANTYAATGHSNPDAPIGFIAGTDDGQIHSNACAEYPYEGGRNRNDGALCSDTNKAAGYNCTCGPAYHESGWQPHAEP